MRVDGQLGSFVSDIRQQFLVAEIRSLLNHQFIFFKKPGFDHHYYQPWILVFVLNLETVFQTSFLRNDTNISEFRRISHRRYIIALSKDVSEESNRNSLRTIGGSCLGDSIDPYSILSFLQAPIGIKQDPDNGWGLFRRLRGFSHRCHPQFCVSDPGIFSFQACRFRSLGYINYFHLIMKTESKICALIPVYNEADVIASVVQETRKYTDQVFVIDDGSNDGTGEIARDAGATWIRLDRNSGKGVALHKGISHIKDEGFDYVVMLDGDGQHCPADIPVLIRTARQQNADMVIGARSFDRNRMPLERFFSNSMGSKATSLLLGREIKDSQCGFRLIRMEKLRNLRLRAKKYEIEMEILIKMDLAGCSIVHAPISMIYDNARARSKMRPIRDTIRICIWSLLFRFLGF
jgi:hypothetical protein